MNTLFRDQANSVGPAAAIIHNAISLDLPLYGYSPIPIKLRRLGHCRLDATGTVIVNSGHAQTWVDGALVDAICGAGNFVDLLGSDGTGIVIPAVVESNVDGAARYGWKVIPQANNMVAKVTLDYQAVNTSDKGKQILGIGTDLGTALAPYLAPPQAWGGIPGSWNDGSGGSQTFASPVPGVHSNVADWEISDLGYTSGQDDGVASIPWCFRSIWDDFKVVLRAPVSGDWQFEIRVDRTTVKTLRGNNAQRVWDFPGLLDIHTDALVCILNRTNPGVSLIGDIIWTSRVIDDTGVLGGGESGGEY